jgi:hypothetical protein
VIPNILIETKPSYLMKYLIILPLILLVLASCGPSKSQLRTELKSVETQMEEIVSAAQQYRSAVSQSEFDSFIGSFVAGYGAVAGDSDLVGQGATTAIDSDHQYTAASAALAQLGRRYNALAKLRTEILSQLR